MNGNGKFNWYDGKKYQGSFLNGELHGNGSIEYPGGQVVIGEWNNGESVGVDKITHN